VGFTEERWAAPRRCALEQGFTLVEVIVAGVIMLTVLLPTAMLMSSSTKALSLNQTKVVAANLASGVLEEARAAADSQTWSGTPVSPNLPAPQAPGPINGVTYTVTEQSGWCAPATVNGVSAWADYASMPSSPPAYGVLVTVTWLGASHVLTFGEVLTTPVTAVNSVPSSSASCKL
jgi:type II secretory pathway pseudopilin PulG